MGHIRGTFSILYHFLVLDLKRFICFPISCVFHVSEKKLGEVTKHVRRNDFRRNGIRRNDHFPKKRDRKSELVLSSTYQIFEWDRNNSDRNFYNVVRYAHIPLVP